MVFVAGSSAIVWEPARSTTRVGFRPRQGDSGLSRKSSSPATSDVRRLYAENLELRELLLAVAVELERIAAHEEDAENWRVHCGVG